MLTNSDHDHEYEKKTQHLNNCKTLGTHTHHQKENLSIVPQIDLSWFNEVVINTAHRDSCHTRLGGSKAKRVLEFGVYNLLETEILHRSQLRRLNRCLLCGGYIKTDLNDSYILSRYDV